MRRMRYSFVLMVLLASCVEDHGIEQCAKACKDGGATMKSYSAYGACVCQSSFDVKLGVAK
jgi:hypothetical protein